MKILCLSDKKIDFIYSPAVRSRFPDVDIIIGCGDLAYYYLEYVLTAMNCPLFFVRGNHDNLVEHGETGDRNSPHGGTDLHCKVVHHNEMLLAGVEGSLRYRPGKFQYSQGEMWENVFRLVPRLFYNRLKYGRYLDIFVSHAPPEGIHDQSDLPHQGIKAFRWLVTTFQPACHLHGHVHVYRPDVATETRLGETRVINSYGYKEITVG